MLRYFLLFCILCSVSCFNFKRSGPKCDSKNYKCMAQIVNDVLQISLPGIEELGVESLDPLHQALIEKHLPDSEFYLINSTVTGFKDVVINEVIVLKNKTSSQTTLRHDLTLPHYEMTGSYKFNGKLNGIVAEGEGKYDYNATNIHLIIDTLKEFHQKDGKTFLKLSNIRVTIEVIGNVQMRHYDSGAKALPEPALKFLNENPNFLLEIWQDAIGLANMNKMFDNFNKILATVPLDALISGDSFKAYFGLKKNEN